MARTVRNTRAAGAGLALLLAAAVLFSNWTLVRRHLPQLMTLPYAGIQGLADPQTAVEHVPAAPRAAPAASVPELARPAPSLSPYSAPGEAHLGTAHVARASALRVPVGSPSATAAAATVRVPPAARPTESHALAGAGAYHVGVYLNTDFHFEMAQALAASLAAGGRRRVTLWAQPPLGDGFQRLAFSRHAAGAVPGLFVVGGKEPPPEVSALDALVVVSHYARSSDWKPKVGLANDPSVLAFRALVPTRRLVAVTHRASPDALLDAVNGTVVVCPTPLCAAAGLPVFCEARTRLCSALHRPEPTAYPKPRPALSSSGP